MKVHEVIKWLSKLPSDDDIIINWWTHRDILNLANDLTYDEWKQVANRINGSADWSYIFDAAIEESYDIVARREDLFKDKSG